MPFDDSYYMGGLQFFVLTFMDTSSSFMAVHQLSIKVMYGGPLVNPYKYSQGKATKSNVITSKRE
jgi:hypothetical protein